MYLDADVKINDVQGPIAQTFLRIDDKRFNTYPSILPRENDSKDQMDWLWAYFGNLLIISTPYYDGVHYATLPDHFTPIIDNLEKLHKQGYVHGDIRAYNMVLKYNTTSSDQSAVASGTGGSAVGWLIDFDFGGKHNAVTYPKGYKVFLYDGYRPGREKRKITIMDDWKSLIGLIFNRYDFVAIKELTDPERVQISKKEDDIKKYLKKMPKDNDPWLSNIEEPANLLRNYIDYVKEIYSVEPENNFQTDLQNCGFWSKETSLPVRAASTSKCI